MNDDRNRPVKCRTCKHVHDLDDRASNQRCPNCDQWGSYARLSPKGGIMHRKHPQFKSWGTPGYKLESK